MSDTLQPVVSLHTLNVGLNERHDKLKRIGHAPYPVETPTIVMLD
jgi:hypothetical protein